MSNGIINELYKLMSEEKIPDDVSAKMILAALIETLNKINEVGEQVRQMDGRVQKLEKTQEHNPSLLFMFRNQPVSLTLKNLSNIVALVVLVVYLLSHIPQGFLFRLLGLPVP
ncbi:MAG: hypothetical protein KF770_08585 [Anaerolineae bacterium]|nr:hypothetical protein [Anaerolineae bacterium]